MTIGQRIKALREKRGMSVIELAERLGKARSTVYRYESDDIVDIPITVLQPLAEELGTTPAYLMGWGFPQRLLDIMSYRGLSAADLAEAIHVSGDSLERMLAGDLEPTYEEFRDIARVLNVTEECLSGSTEIDIVEPGVHLSLTDPQEQELVGIYRGLNDNGQTVLMGTARSLNINAEMKKNSAPTLE